MPNIKKYKVGEIKGILNSIYNDPETRRTAVPLLMSSSGLGKTRIVEDFMKEKGVYKPPFVLSQRMPFEVSGMAMVDKDLDKMKYYDFDFLLELKDGDILFIDETFAANINTLAAFLTFLESRIMISGRKLPDIMIVAAANEHGMPSLTPQVRRRFLQYDIVFDNVAFNGFLKNKYAIPSKISNKLNKLIKEEKFIGYNYDTPADIDKAINMIIKGIGTPYATVIKPILETIVENPFNEDVVLSDSKVLAANEQIKWLDLIRLSEGIELPTIEEEILILDKEDNVLGKIKDVATLTNLHFIGDSAIDKLNMGQTIKLPSPETAWDPVFIKKKITK